MLNTLGQLSVYTETLYLRKLICQKLSGLERKKKLITFRWIPGYLRLVGHNKTNQIGREKA